MAFGLIVCTSLYAYPPPGVWTIFQYFSGGGRAHPVYASTTIAISTLIMIWFSLISQIKKRGDSQSLSDERGAGHTTCR
jgi:hypothetical protein